MLAQSQQTLEENSQVLANSRIIQLIVYVHDLAESREFYENLLGLRVLESDDDSVKLDTGQVLLCLNRARDYGITLASQRDDSSDTVFLVDDIEAMRAALEKRGIIFARSRTYEIGAVVDFYDPNGHRLMLYQPSEHSLVRTPSGNKIRAVWRASGRGGSQIIGPAAETVDATPDDLEEWGLDGKPLLYFFVFIGNMNTANNFYEASLGLRAFERAHCCNNTCPGEEKGIVKYDGGGVILSTHHMHGHHAVLDDHGNPYGAKEFEPEFAKGVAPVFHVQNLEQALDKLSQRGLGVSRSIVRSRNGITASIDAPFGHLYYLYEPSAEALTGPIGDKLKQILAAEV
jgi:catechol 2,3-dioxygenase-like lactoylglutathione lyase family enzyme